MNFYKARCWIAGIIITLLVIGAISYISLQKSVEINVDGRTIKVKTFAKTVDDLIKNQNINLKQEDVVIPELESDLKDNMNIQVKRAFPVKILCDGKQKTINSQPDTVESLLVKAGILLGQYDKVEPELSCVVRAPRNIEVTRVKQEVTEELKAIPYKTITKKDSSMEVGQKKILQQGQDGQEKIITTSLIENGKVVSEETKVLIVKEPKAKIVLEGTIKVATRAGVDFNYTKKVRMLASAYTHTGGLTARGTRPRVGVVAVDPNVIPLGTRLYIDGYGFAKAEDTGGSIKGDKIDLFLPTMQQTRNFGRRWVTVYVLK